MSFWGLIKFLIIALTGCGLSGIANAQSDAPLTPPDEATFRYIDLDVLNKAFSPLGGRITPDPRGSQHKMVLRGREYWLRPSSCKLDKATNKLIQCKALEITLIFEKGTVDLDFSKERWEEKFDNLHSNLLGLKIHRVSIPGLGTSIMLSRRAIANVGGHYGNLRSNLYLLHNNGQKLLRELGPAKAKRLK